VGLAVALTAMAVAQERDARIAEGKELFTAHGCYGCHLVEKYGTPIGPELSKIGGKRGQADLERWLADPASQKPTAHMPRIQLALAEIRALAAYLASLR
jgi:cytochrome c oxidase subunit 2